MSALKCSIGPSGVPEITVNDLNEQKAKVQIVDVRRPDEFSGELGHIDGAMFSTLETDLETTLEKLPKDKIYVFVCRSGGHSGHATQMAQQKGFKDVYNMKGGMLAWNAAGFDVKR